MVYEAKKHVDGLPVTLPIFSGPNISSNPSTSGPSDLWGRVSVCEPHAGTMCEGKPRTVMVSWWRVDQVSPPEPGIARTRVGIRWRLRPADGVLRKKRHVESVRDK